MAQERTSGKVAANQKYIVSDDCRFVYFVVQKVACSSIKTALLPLFDLDASEYERTSKDGPLRLDVHKMFDDSKYQIRGNRPLEGLEERYVDYFKFAFVRNPWDRLVSCYTEKLLPQGSGLTRYKYAGIELYVGMPFAEFVEAVHQIPDEKSNVHFRSQYRTVCNEQGEIMADFVGRFENLGEDFAYVKKNIGAPEIQLPHLLRSKDRGDRSYAEFYDERLKELVRERYREDIERFGYSFSAESAPASMDLRPSVARLYRERTKSEDRTRSFEVRLQELESDLKEERGRTASLKKENRRLSRRVENLEGRLEAVRTSRAWRFVTALDRLKTSFKARVSGKS